MANSKDVELRIRARDFSQKPLKAVASAIEAMAKAQDDQRKAAERGEVSTRQLEASYKKLEQAGQQLLKLNALVELYKRQNATMVEAAQKTEDLRAKQAQLQQAYDSAAKVTKKQEAELARVNRQVERAERTEASRAAQVSRTTKELQRYGIETKTLGAAQSSIVNSVASVNKVLQQQENIIATAPAAAAQNKVIQGLQQQAQQALAAAKGYSTLGRVVQTTTSQMGPLASKIQQIISPSDAARRTLSGLQQQVHTLASEVSTSGNAIKDLAQKTKMLNEANRAAAGLAQQIDQYRQQVAVMRTARAEYQAARTAVITLAQEMRTATGDTANLTARMASAQQRLSSAARALRDAGSAARVSQAGLRTAGVDTRNLTAEEQQLVSISQQATKALSTLSGSLRSQSQQALATARSYSVLASSVQASSLMGPLTSQIQQIVSPAEAARRTLSGLQQQVTTLATEIANSGKKVTDITGKIRQLNEANKSVSAMAQQIDMYRQQVAAVRAARTEYRTAMGAVQGLAQQMRTATTDTGELSNRMQAAQQRLAAAARSLRDTGTAARTTQLALRSAGIDTRNLNSAEQALISTSRQTTSSINSLTQALRNNAGATRDGAKAFSLFRDEGRTTLSMLQRIRGEVLGLATAYVGVQGALNQASGAVGAYKMRQQALVKISTVVGNSQEALNAEWQYMLGLSDKLGIDLGTLAQSYTKFAVASTQVGLSLQESKFIFESVAKAGRVFHLSAADMDGIFRAMQQMLSKGQVYAEELNSQLAERLPGAVALYAKGMNMTTGELLKAMQNSEVLANSVVNFAREQAKAVDAQLDTATKGVDAMEARARNAMTEFQLAIAESGFLEAYANLLYKITEYLNSSDGHEAAVKLGAAFSSVADTLVYLIDNLDTVIEVLGVLAGLKITRMVLGLVGSIRTMLPVLKGGVTLIRAVYTGLMTWATGLATAEGAVGLLGVALRGLLRVIPFVGAALIAYDIGSIMYDQSSTFRQGVDEVVRDYKNLGNQLLAVGESIPTMLYDILIGWVRPVTTQFATATKMIMGWIAEVLRLIPGVGETLANWADGLADDLTKEHRDFLESTGKVWDDVEKKWADMNNNMIRINQTAVAAIKRQIATLPDMIKAIQNPEFQFTADPETGVTKRDRDIKSMTKDLAKMEEQAKKAGVAAQKALQRKNLPGRLKLIDEEFAPQYQRAKGIGGNEGAAMIKRLDAIVAARKKAETDSYNAMENGSKGRANAAKREENALAALTAQYEKLDDAVGVKQSKVDPNATFDDRLQAKLQAVNTQYDQLIAKANKLGSGGAELAGKFEDLRKRNLEYTTTQAKLEEIKRVEDQLNAVQETKKNLLDEINAKRQAGIISEDEAVKQTSELYATMNVNLQQSADTLDQLAQKFRNVLSPEDYAALMAKIAQIRAGLNDVTGTFTQMDSTVVQGVLDGLATGLQSVTDSLVQVLSGTMSLGDAFRSLGATVTKFFADFLMKIAQAILQQMILNSLAGIGGGIGAAATSMGGVAAKHNGGMVGSKTTGGQQRKNSVSPSLFVGAPRFHDGGLPGLKSDEVPIIAQKGEQILSKDDPNNIMNRGSDGGSGSSNPQDIRVINAIDSASVVAAGLTAPENSKVILNYIKANKQAVKQVLG